MLWDSARIGGGLPARIISCAPMSRAVCEGAWQSLIGSANPKKSEKSKEDCMQFRPLHDRVVVKRIEAEEKTAGGIIIPDTAKEKPSQGEVIAVGPGGRDETGKLIPIDIQVGDRVLFGKWSGTEVKIDGQELLIMKESDVMGVLTDVAGSKKKAA
jgi:chaperonin GroES